MCKLTIAKPKLDVIWFEIDVITLVVLYLKKKILFIKKVPVPESIKKKNLFG